MVDVKYGACPDEQDLMDRKYPYEPAVYSQSEYIISIKYACVAREALYSLT
jgi:hypothetical protein